MKTLKDIKKGYQLKNRIRQEVIKWVKDRISNCENCNMINIRNYKEEPIICDEHKFWMDKLNVTEEDLK